MKVLAIALALALSGCVQNQPSPPSSLAVSSPAFQEGGTIPSKYTCDGADVSPPLEVSGIPNNTVSLAVVFTDPEAPGGEFTHWIAWNIPANATQLPEGTVPQGTVEGLNDFGRTGYGGPCPPAGERHRYVLRVYALDSWIDLPEGSSKQDLLRAMEGHVLAEGSTIGFYSRTAQ